MLIIGQKAGKSRLWGEELVTKSEEYFTTKVNATSEDESKKSLNGKKNLARAIRNVCAHVNMGYLLLLMVELIVALLLLLQQ